LINASALFKDSSFQGLQTLVRAISIPSRVKIENLRYI
jgi:hypothetical protein